MKTNKPKEIKKDMLDTYEASIEKTLSRGDYVSDTNLPLRKKEFLKASQNYKDNRKTKQISLRINSEDLTKIKNRAKKNNIPYQTLIGALIRQYAAGKSNLVIWIKS